jgi:predicted metal-dependent peptidase
MTVLPPTIAKARARLLVRSPFFGSIALGLVWVNAPEIGTMATDGRHLWFSPAWCDHHGVDKIMGVIAHEVLHVVNKHHLRRGERDLRLWNRAADLMINRVLENDQFVLPPDGLFDREGRFAGLPVETIYARLLEDQEAAADQEKQGGSAAPANGAGGQAQAQAQENAGGPPATGESEPGGVADQPGTPGGIAPAHIWGEVRDLRAEDGKPLAPAARRQAESDLDIRIQQAAAAAKRAGRFSGLLKEVVEAATDRVDWQDKFRTTFDGTLRGDVSWSRPNRRFLPHGIYLPGWRRTGAGRVAFVLDTSCSISARELAVYTAGVLGILDEVGPEQVALIQCDAEVRDVVYLGPGESFDRIEIVGRGGTRFQPAFDWITGSGFAPQVIVYATDLCSIDAPTDPGVPVTWLTPTRGRSMPFGEIVEVSL